VLDHSPGAYGEAFVDVYDDWYQDISDVDATVGSIAELAGSGRVLELGVGTGRLAIPLASRGVPTVGVDASPAMVAIMRAKPGGRAVMAVLGDMADPPVTGPFSVVFVAFNTFFNLTTEMAQKACVRNVVSVLDVAGRFVVEAFIPNAEPTETEHGTARRGDGSGGSVETSTIRDPSDQTVQAVSLHIGASGSERARPWTIRYLHPHQLDTLCRAAGLTLEQRWASFTGEPFDPDGDRHVSVYRRDRTPSD
jgi:SAM-dependent methyltransferase